MAEVSAQIASAPEIKQGLDPGKGTKVKEDNEEPSRLLSYARSNWTLTLTSVLKAISYIKQTPVRLLNKTENDC